MSVFQSFSSNRYKNFYLAEINLISESIYSTPSLTFASTCLRLNFNKSFNNCLKSFKFFVQMKFILLYYLCYNVIWEASLVFLLVSRTNKQASRLMSFSCWTETIIVSQFYPIIRPSCERAIINIVTQISVWVTWSEMILYDNMARWGNR